MKDTSIQKQFISRLSPDEDFFKIFDLLPEVSFYLKDRQSRFMVINRKGCEICGVAKEDDAIGAAKILGIKESSFVIFISAWRSRRVLR